MYLHTSISLPQHSSPGNAASSPGSYHVNSSSDLHPSSLHPHQHQPQSHHSYSNCSSTHSCECNRVASSAPASFCLCVNTWSTTTSLSSSSSASSSSSSSPPSPSSSIVGAAHSYPSLAFIDPNAPVDTTCPPLPQPQRQQQPSMDPLERFLSQHSQYHEPFDRLHTFLLRGEGPLPFTVRHYIAIMAAARHYCKFLVNQQKEEFRSVGGDPKWLLGLEHAPAKIRNLNEINKLLAHQPWLLTKEHIAKLTKGDDSWSLSELVQAIVLLAHFHSLASFVFGCGFNDFDQSWLNTNVSTIASCTSSSTTPTATSTTTASCPTESNNLCDLLTSHTTRSTPPSPPSSTDKPLSAPVTLNAPFWTTASPQQSIGSLDSLPGQGQNSLEQLMHKMRSISEHRQQFSENDNQEELVKNQSLEIDLAGGLPTTPLKLTSSANEDENVSATPIQTGVARSSITVCSPPILSPAFSSTTLASVSSLDGANDADLELSRFVLDRKFAYVDFARQRATADITTFRVQDYSWSDHAYSLLNRFYPDVGCLLDDKFQITYNLTYFTMGRKTNVDTTIFRRAIWNYIQCMYGIRHDDYDYHEVNELLERNLKTYIKTVCCFPHQTRRRDCDLVMREFRRSEKIHVNMMIAEARLQAELLYALRTVMRYMT